MRAVLVVFILVSNINFGLIAQDVDIDGKLKVSNVTEDLYSTEIVIYQSDGTLAKRAINALSSDHYVGELMGVGGVDGIVFWVDHTGEHGLICSPEDVSIGVVWDNNTAELRNASSQWNGHYNTDTLMITQDTMSTEYPAEICVKYATPSTTAGDWYLPAIDELSKMWHAKYEINKALNIDNTFSDFSYWSSSEVSSASVWGFDFSLGIQNSPSYKLDTNTVRAVRVF